VAKKAVAFLNSSYGINIHLEGLAYTFPIRINLKNLLILDTNKIDTCIFANELTLDIKAIRPSENIYLFGDVFADSLRFRLEQQNETSLSNFTVFLESFNRGDTTSSGLPTQLGFDHVKFKNFLFTYRLKNSPDMHYRSQIDFNDVSARALVDVSDLVIIDDSIQAQVNTFIIKEKSGLYLSLAGNTNVSAHQISLENGKVQQNKDALNLKYVSLSYPSWRSFANFTDEVLLDAVFKPSSYNLSNINNWAEGTVYAQVPVEISGGTFKGYVANFNASDLGLKFAESGQFKGELSIDGLPDFNNSFLSVNPKYFRFKATDVNQIIQAFDPSIVLPDNLSTLGNIDLQGSFTGFKDDFVAFCNIKTDIGTLKTDVKLVLADSTITYSGELSTDGFHLGKLTRLADLGKTAFGFKLKGSGTTLETLDATLQGDIYFIEAKGYTYDAIEVDGKIVNQGFKGMINSADPNANFRFQGLINFKEDIPAADFKASIFNLDLNALNLIDSERRLTISSTLNLKGAGTSVKTFTLTADAYNTSVCYKDAETYLDRLTANAGFNEKDKENNFINIDSEIASADIIGSFDFNEMHKIFLKAISQVYPVFEEKELISATPQVYNFNVSVKSFELINEFINTPVNPASDLSCKGYVNTTADKLQMEVHSSYLQYDAQEVKGFDLFVNNYGNIFDVELFADYLGVTPNVYLRNANFGVKGIDQGFQANLMWGAYNEKAGQLYFLGNVLGPSKVSLDILPGFINVDGDVWEITETAKVLVDSSKVFVKDLSIGQKDQLISLEGIVGKEKTDKLYFNLKEINLAKLSDALPDNINITGELSSKGTISGIYEHVIVAGEVAGLNMTLNDQELGDLALKAGWNQEKSALMFDGGFTLNGKQHIGTNGLFFPFDTIETLDLRLTFNRFQLGLLDGLLTDEVTNISGQLSGDISLKGSFAEPKLNGDLAFSQTTFKINYLNTQYILTEKIVVREDYIGLNHVPLIDVNGNVAWVTGTAFHENFSNWNFDIFAEMERFQCLNTKKGMNPDFYGSAYATGSVNIEGYGENVNINIRAKTDKNTEIFVPLDAAKEVYAQEFVEFVNPNEQKVDVIREVRKGLTLDLELDVNSNAEVQLIFDETVGDIIKAKGFGSIRLEVDKLGDLQMFGKYTIEDGDYLFTLQNIVNKKFNVASGSSISWYGDPYAATLDINAQYQLRAPLYDIMLAPEERYKRREQVVLEMHLTEQLLKPAIDFDIRVPTADDFIKGQIRAALSTDNELNRQVFALLMFNRFLAPQNSARATSSGSAAGSTGASTSAELLSNQLSNLVSQISSDVNFGVNYRPGTQLTNRELAVNLSTQILNERITLSGNVGVSENTSNKQSNLLGDVAIEYALTQDGRLRLKAFNETVNSSLLNGNLSPYIQGVGVFYREEFDSLDELYRRFLSLFKRKKKVRFTGNQIEDSDLENLKQNPE